MRRLFLGLALIFYSSLAFGAGETIYEPTPKPALTDFEKGVGTEWTIGQVMMSMFTCVDINYMDYVARHGGKDPKVTEFVMAKVCDPRPKIVRLEKRIQMYKPGTTNPKFPVSISIWYLMDTQGRNHYGLYLDSDPTVKNKNMSIRGATKWRRL